MISLGLIIAERYESHIFTRQVPGQKWKIEPSINLGFLLESDARHKFPVKQSVRTHSLKIAADEKSEKFVKAFRNQKLLPLTSYLWWKESSFGFSLCDRFRTLGFF